MAPRRFFFNWKMAALVMNMTIRKQRRAGFSFVEAIFTIAIIGIMASIVVAAISNASRDAHRVLARSDDGRSLCGLHDERQSTSNRSFVQFAAVPFAA
jgi:type II secretory pathway pseudopilin PulG